MPVGVIRWVPGGSTGAGKGASPADDVPVVDGDGAEGDAALDNGDAIPDEYILSFYSERDREQFIRVAESLGARILDSMDFGFSLRLRAERDLLKRILEQAPSAVDFSANYVMRYPRLPLLDPKQPQGSYRAFGARAVDWLGVPVDNADWGAGVTVAVLDTGVNPHPSLAGVAVTRLDLTGGTGLDTSPEAAHGTAVASLIAADSAAVRGVAPAVEILSIRVISGEGDGDLFTTVRGIIEAVDRGAPVINVSLGTRADSFLLRDAVAYAAANGSIVVAAAGNDAASGVSYPAAYDGALAVSAVDAFGRHMYFANRGESVDLAAPGLGINAAWAGDTTVAFSGTSASAALVSGAVAAILAREPGTSAQEAAALLRRYGDDSGAPGPDSELGDGIINMRRVEERGEPGIYDMAVSLPYLAPAARGEDITTWVYAQNRGTELVRNVELSVDIGGVQHSLRFQNVAVGEIVSQDFRVSSDELHQSGSVMISATATLDGIQDSYPHDNSRQMSIVLAPPTTAEQP